MKADKQSKTIIDFDSILKKIRDESKNTAELGTRFENLTKDFFETDKFYKERFIKVWTWMEYPDRDTRDLGIDLVAEEEDGSLCAIQCKCYADDGSIDMNHVNNFLSLASATKKYKNKILVYTGDTLTRNADIITKKHHCQIITQEHFRASSVDWSKFPKLRIKDPYTLFDYQKLAFDDVVTGFEKHDRGKMIMACGTGKTLVSLHIAEKIAGKGGFVLFLVPSISLIVQCMREWSDNANMKHYYVAVCSDKSTGEEGSITELESPVSTDVQTLKPYIKNRPKDAMTVIFSTYHSIEVVQKAMKGESFDIICCDEAHRTTGIENRSYWTFVHDNKNIDSKKRLYMTATPRIYQEKIKAKVGDILYSMDNEEKYGPDFHKLSFHDAVRKYNALSDFKVKVVAISADKVDKEFQKSVAGEEMSMPLDERTLLAGVWHGLNYPNSTYNEKTGKWWEGKPELLQRVIAFANRIDRSQMFAGMIDDPQGNSRGFEKVVRQFNAIEPTGNTVEIEHVDGKNNAMYRREKMRWLSRSNKDQKTCRILSNARCLSEGVDVPALDGVVFLNPRKSVVDIVQSVGRVMRKSPGKKFGYIILPVATPAGVSTNEALDNNETFKVVWQTLNALRSHDEMFGDEINKLILDKHTENLGDVTPRISITVLDDQEEEEPIADLFDKIKSKLVEKVGDFDYYDKYGAQLGKASQTVELRIRNMLESSDSLSTELGKFHDELKKVVNESVTKDEVIRVISQHVILSRVFNALFSGEFTSYNPMSKVLSDIAGKFGLNEELQELEKIGFYDDVKKEVDSIRTATARQNFIKTIYGNFFASTAKKETEQHGVVYTPVEIIDFIIQSVEVLLHENFNSGFNNRAVKVLDPFAGTGTFLTRLLESELITDNLYEKYKNDLFANELILLAYYIATVNIETTYSNLRKSGKYVAFEGISYTDTLRMNPQYRQDKRHRQEVQVFGATFKTVHERIRNQRGAHVHVMMGNPPYSKGQSSFSDNNPNIEYPEIDNRITNTYAKKVKTGNINALFDSYVRSLRWASDRLGRSGIIAFITNASFIKSQTASGIRACLEEEFNEIWCFDLRGNQRTQGETSRKEGGKIFGSGSRTPVSIIILVKNPNKKTHIIHYKDIGDYLSRERKLEIISSIESIRGINDWTIIKPDNNYDWVDQKIRSFTLYLPIGIAKSTNENAVFRRQGNGLATSRDSWVYNFSKGEISKNMKRQIEYCNKQDLSDRNLNKKEHDPRQVSWTGDLLHRLKNNKTIFDKNKIRISLYRPFYKQYLYYDYTFNHRLSLFPKIFPDVKSENLVISITTKMDMAKFSALISNTITDVHVVYNSVCFPLYVYENGKKERKENITNVTLEEYQIFYKDKKITKEDIFYYVYGLLHHPKYREKYATNLSKELPHIPMAPKFWEYAKAGRNLAKLHLNYENGKKYNLGTPKNKKIGKLEKISFGKKTIDRKRTTDYTEIWINGVLVFDNIPKMNYHVNGRTPLECVVDRYKISIDKDSGNVNDPGDVDIISLIERVVFVGMESDKIIKQLPKEFEPKDWKPRKKGLDSFIDGN